MQTPILFLIFNRPNTTQKVFNVIREARPKQLFIAADGPRKNKLEENELCEKAREVINQVDWDCEIKTLFRDENLGCKQAVSSAINWFFENVERGIILEDDCLPNESFFVFCEKMLELYSKTNKVMMISGTNNLNLKEIDQDYFFSHHFNIWGWATWRRAWRLNTLDMSEWPNFKKRKELFKIYKNKKIVSYYSEMFEANYLDMIDTWDIQWNFTCLKVLGLSCVPKYNLVSNIGDIGTHTPKNTNDNPNIFKQVRNLDSISFKKKTPKVNLELDNIQFDNFAPKFKLRNIYSKLLIFKMKYFKR